MSIKQQVTKSVFWSAVERFSVQGVQFILSLIIARLLLPADYGLDRHVEYIHVDSPDLYR